MFSVQVSCFSDFAISKLFNNVTPVSYYLNMPILFQDCLKMHIFLHIFFIGTQSIDILK